MFYVQTRIAAARAALACRLLLVMALLLVVAQVSSGRQTAEPQNAWQSEVRRLCDAHDWPTALRIVDEELVRSPKDLEVKAWRARVLTWAGRLEEAEQTYREVLRAEDPGHYDPDHWFGLATVCWRQGKTQEALQAIKTAVEIDPKRADLHVTYARILQSAGQRAQAEAEYKKASDLDPGTFRTNQPIKAGKRYPMELRAGSDTDALNYAGTNQGQWANFSNHWTPHISTNVGFGLYQRSGVFAGKFIGALTVRADAIGALTVGGAKAEDHGVIPRSEAFFDFDHGFKNRESNFFRGIEFEYNQHWYWYATARILAHSSATTFYFPRDWSLTVGATGARSAFSGVGAEWRPSGVARLSLPLHTFREKQLTGNVFFGAGTENFGLADQIGRFASQTYGGGLRCEWSSRQFISYTLSYQRRTQGRTDMYNGVSYGIRF